MTAVAAHAFVADLDVPTLDPVDRHHLERVLRVRRGDPVTVADGRGRWRLCRFGPALEPIDAVVTDPAPDPPVAVAFALVKGERPELIVQKLTELGVDRIVPFAAARSVVRWDGQKAARHHERLVAIAREAAMQSRRTWLPVVEPPARFAEVAAQPGAALADRGNAPLDAAIRHVLVGPEGGWTDDERAAPIPSVGLGDNVLRAETAAIAAAVLLCAFRDQRVCPGPCHGQ